MTTLTVYNNSASILLPENTDKNTRSRVGQFITWMGDRPLHDPDLSAYRDVLLATRSAASTRAHLSTIRAQYSRITKDNNFREWLYSQVPEDVTAPADRKAWVDEALTRLQNATDPSLSQVTVVKEQDVTDTAQIRLTREQAEVLLKLPGVNTLLGLRDTAVIALMLCTGIREAELCNLDASDLRQQFGGELALHVRSGKNSKSRLVPYGDLDWCLVVVDRWLSAAGITDGAVFRGLYKGGASVRDARLNVKTVERIVSKYPVTVNGSKRSATPHDLRRTYARRLYDAGLDLVSIQQNLGHSDVKTTLAYIGTLDASKRRAKDIYSFDLRILDDAPGD